MEGTITESDSYSIDTLPILADAGLSGVAIGVGQAVPQVGLFYVQLDDSVVGRIGCARGYLVAVGILDRDCHSGTAGVHREQVHAGLAPC